MSIVIYTGRPGAGKTYWLTWRMLRSLNKGRVVYSNYKIIWHGYRGKRFNWRKFRFEPVEYPASNLRSWEKLSDLLTVSNCDIAIDEAHFYFNSRKWKDMPMDFMRKVAQHRKDAIHIFGTVQNIQRIDVVVRELVDFWYVCKHIPFGFMRYEFDIDEDKQRKYVLSTSFIWFTQKRASRYDTLQKIGE